MQNRRVRLIVTTNTNIRFLTALPADHSIQKALPILLSRYRTVVSENLGKDHELIKSQSIVSLTKKGCLIARDELIGEVFADNDEISINLDSEEESIDGHKEAAGKLSKR